MPDVEFQRARLGEPEERGQVVADQVLVPLVLAAGPDADRVHELRPRLLPVLLEEALAADAVGHADHRERPVGQVREDVRRHLGEVAQQVALGDRRLLEAGIRWPVDAIEVGQLEAMGTDGERDRGALVLELPNHVVDGVVGRVGLRQVDIGNLVQAGQTNGIVVVTQEQPISVMFALPEDNISDIMTRVKQGATLSVEAYDRGQTVKLATGKLATVDNVIDPTTGTVKMRAMFDNPDGALFPNQFVNVRLLVNTLHNQIWVPASAVERGSQGPFVYVIETDKSTTPPTNTVAMRGVTLGPQDGDKIAVTKGLNPGENVVTDGADRLRDGSDVTVAKGPKTSTVKPPADAQGAQDGGGFAARRAQMQKMCAADIAKFCSDSEGRARGQCLREHMDDLSDGCKTVMSKMGRHGRGGAQ